MDEVAIERRLREFFKARAAAEGAPAGGGFVSETKVTRDHLDDLLAFVGAIRERLASE